MNSTIFWIINLKVNYIGICNRRHDNLTHRVQCPHQVIQSVNVIKQTIYATMMCYTSFITLKTERTKCLYIHHCRDYFVDSYLLLVYLLFSFTRSMTFYSTKLFILSFASITAQILYCPIGYYHHPSLIANPQKCFKIYSNKLNYSDAKHYCTTKFADNVDEGRGGKLVSIGSEFENRYIHGRRCCCMCVEK